MPIKRLVRNTKPREIDRLRAVYLNAERRIVDEINRSLARGTVDYHSRAALDRVRKILTEMQDASFKYVPRVMENIVRAGMHPAGYANAANIANMTGRISPVVEMLSDNLLGEIVEATEKSYRSAADIIIGRQEPDAFREVINQKAAEGTAAGYIVKGLENGLVFAVFFFALLRCSSGK